MFNHQEASIEDQQKQVVVSIDQAEKIIELRDQITKLSKNKLFKTVVLDGYFKEEAIRLTSIYNSPNLSAEDNAKVLKDLEAIGSLRRYFQTKTMLGNVAESELVSHRQTLEELNALEADEEDQGDYSDYTA